MRMHNGMAAYRMQPSLDRVACMLLSRQSAPASMHHSITAAGPCCSALHHQLKGKCLLDVVVLADPFDVQPSAPTGMQA